MNGDTKNHATKVKNINRLHKNLKLCIKGHKQQSEKAMYRIGKVCKSYN